MEDLGTGGTDVGGCALTGLSATEQLGFDGDGKVLIFSHCLRRLAVEHDAVIAEGPVRTALRLLTHETIFSRDDVMGEFPVAIEDVAEMAAELRVLIVRDLKEPVFDTKGVPVVLPQGIARDLRDPAIEVLSVEELNPVFPVRVITVGVILGGRGSREKGHEGEDGA